MILPSQLHIDWTFSAVPVWGWEPAERGADRQGATAPPAQEAAEGVSPACGETEPPPLMLVFKGYEWRPAALWECLANPDWDHWTDCGRDDAVEHARRDERNRQAGAPKPPASLPPGADAPAGPDAV